jgi:hypothetical protein
MYGIALNPNYDPLIISNSLSVGQVKAEGFS